MDAGDADRPVPDAFCCPITQELMVDPVMVVDGHCYERTAIERWFGQRQARGQPPTSPKTGAELASTELTPNHNLRNAIQECVVIIFCSCKS